MSLWWRHNIYLWRHNGARCWKIAPKPFVYTDPKIILTYHNFLFGKTIWDWIERYFLNSGIFPKSRCLFYQSVPHCLRFYHCEPQVQKLLDFFIHLSIPALGQFVTIKTSQGEFSCGKTLFHQETTYFTQKNVFFLTRYRSPNGPHLLRMAQPIRSPEILEPPWSVLDT